MIEDANELLRAMAFAKDLKLNFIIEDVPPVFAVIVSGLGVVERHWGMVCLVNQYRVLFPETNPLTL